MKKIVASFLLVCLIFSLGCDKGLFDGDVFRPDCDGVATLTLGLSANHELPHACYNEGENLSYTLCPTPSPCGGGDYTITFTELNFAGQSFGDSFVKSWVEDCKTGKYVVATSVAANIKIVIKNKNGTEVFSQEFSAERDE